MAVSEFPNISRFFFQSAIQATIFSDFFSSVIPYTYRTVEARCGNRAADSRQVAQMRPRRQAKDRIINYALENGELFNLLNV